MDLKRPNLDEAMRALKDMREGTERHCREIVERAERDVAELQAAIEVGNISAGLIHAASNVWVRDLDYRDVEARYQNLRCTLAINQQMGHGDGIVNERQCDGQPPIVAPGRYRAILCLIPIKETP